MDNLHIQGSAGTFFTPTVDFNAQTGQCSISGESYLEESFEFYDRLTEWIEQYFKEGGSALTLDFRLIYFNTSSSRAIVDLLNACKQLTDQGKSLTVNWHYPDPDDDEIKMEAEDFMDETGLTMNLVEYKAEEA